MKQSKIIAPVLYIDVLRNGVCIVGKVNGFDFVYQKSS